MLRELAAQLRWTASKLRKHKDGPKRCEVVL